jgi:hypothetical protein
MQVQPLQRQKR